jgi:hypothetical protein
MKKWSWIYFSVVIILWMFMPFEVLSQCSICTRTAEQLGTEPAKGLNMGIIYLGVTPFLIIGYIGYRWWKDNKGE